MTPALIKQNIWIRKDLVLTERGMVAIPWRTQASIGLSRVAQTIAVAKLLLLKCEYWSIAHFRVHEPESPRRTMQEV